MAVAEEGRILFRWSISRNCDRIDQLMWAMMVLLGEGGASED